MTDRFFRLVQQLLGGVLYLARQNTTTTAPLTVQLLACVLLYHVQNWVVVVVVLGGYKVVI